MLVVLLISCGGYLGATVVVPGQLLPPPHVQLAKQPRAPGVIPATKRSYPEVTPGISPLDSAEWIYMRKGGQLPLLGDKYADPFCMLARGAKVFKLQVGERTEIINRDRLKLHMGVDEPEAAMMPRRGRPPGSDSMSSRVG